MVAENWVTALLLIWLVCRVLSSQTSDSLKLVFCDVGQGDAILISRGTHQMLIDGGKDSSVMECLEDQAPFWDRSLEVVVSTHPDSDHIAGLSDVLDSYQVSLIITNQQTKETADFERLRRAISRQETTGGTHHIASVGEHIKLDKYIDITILNPSSENLVNLSLNTQKSETILSDVEQQSVQMDTDFNNQSVVMVLSYKEIDVLLTGDLETKGEQALLEQELIDDIDVLKVGHHGAKSSSSTQFIARSSPEISVISVGKNNRYGHPSAQVIQQLEEIGSVVLRTDQLSTIVLRSDGHRIWQESSSSFTDTLIAGWVAVKNSFF